MPIINIVVGPPCAGKSTYINDNRKDDDVVVDYDKLACSLGSTVRHQSTGSIKKIAGKVRWSAINNILKGVTHDSWIIHTNPSQSTVDRYHDHDAVFHLIDPGKEECLNRSKSDNRPDGTDEVIEQWYESPPSITRSEETTEQASIRSKSMPFPKSFSQSGVRCDISPRAQELWNPAIQAAVENTESTITVYGIIGEDWYGEGVTLKRIDAALRSIGADKDVTIYINSPGGDMFEGIAIYNRLLEHKGKVTTKVLGLAASAASVIYMAGADDARFVASSAFLMIHNCWVFAIGNRHALRNIADDMEEFDAAMVDLYVEGSGQSEKAIATMMDEETFIRGKKAVELGFAAGTLSAAEIGESTDNTSANSLRKVDAAMAKAGVPRSERRQLLQDLKSQDLKSSTPSAAGGITLNADVSDTQNAVAPDLTALINASNTILSK